MNRQLTYRVACLLILPLQLSTGSLLDKPQPSVVGIIFWSDADTRMFYRLFERALDTCGLEFRSDKLWDKFIDWEVKNENYPKITQIYRRLLSTPTKCYSTHFDKYGCLGMSSAHPCFESLAQNMLHCTDNVYIQRASELLSCILCHSQKHCLVIVI